MLRFAQHDGNDMKDASTEASWPAAWRSPLRFAAVFFGVAVILIFLWTARSIFVVAFLGILFGVSIMPIVEWLHRHRVPRGLGAAATLVAFFVLLTALVLLLVP